MNRKTLIFGLSALLLILLITVPGILKNKVSKLLVAEIESESDYQVTYENVKVAFFRNFPRVKMNIEAFRMATAEDTFLYVPSFEGELSLGKVMKNELELGTVSFFQPKLKYHVKKEVDSDTPTHKISNNPGKQEEENNPFALFKVKHFTITDGSFFIENTDSTSLSITGVNYEMSGAINQQSAAFMINLGVAAMTYRASGFSVSDVPLNLDVMLGYDLTTSLLTVGDNKLSIGGVKTSFEGDVELLSKPVFNLHFEAPETQVSDVLAILPKRLIRDVEQLETDGDVKVSGFVRGVYLGRESLPAYGFDFKLRDAWFKYKYLPEKVESINFSASLEHSEATPADSTVIWVEKMALRSGANYLVSDLKISSPLSDVAVAGTLKGKMDLEALKNVVPMAASDIVGKLQADVSFNGKLSDIEQENYADFDASGYLDLDGYYLKNKSLPQGLSITKAKLDFTPDRINLRSFSGRLGSSDLRLSGYLSNYFAYVFDEKSLKGNLQLNSRFINLNEFMIAQSGVNANQSLANAAKNNATSSFIIPGDLDLLLNANISKIRADDMIMTNCKGKLALNDSRIQLDNFNLNTLGGSIKVNGQYNTQNTSEIYSDLDLYVKNVEIAQAVKSVTLFKTMFPSQQITEGKLSSEMSYYARLDERGEVDLKSVKSKGYLSSTGVRIANNKSLTQLAKQMKDPRYADITTGPVKIDYTMEEGQLILAPFDVKVVDKNIHTGGWYNIDNTLNFRIKTTVKAKEIGGDVSKYVAMVSDPNKPLPVTVIITGNAKQPNIKYDTREAIKILREDVTKNLNGDAVRSILKGIF